MSHDPALAARVHDAFWRASYETGAEAVLDLLATEGRLVEPKPRHVCQVCERDDITITASGVMRRHSGNVWEGGWRQVCKGAGLPPKEATE